VRSYILSFADHGLATRLYLAAWARAHSQGSTYAYVNPVVAVFSGMACIARTDRQLHSRGQCDHCHGSRAGYQRQNEAESESQDFGIDSQGNQLTNNVNLEVEIGEAECPHLQSRL